MPEKHLIVLVGPTAVGKTTLSIELAKEFDTEIISADSRQVFKEISIGTAKPSIEEMQGITHHFINSYSIHDLFNAGKFEEQAIPLIERLFQKYNVLILIGGSGLYIDAICKGFDQLPESDENIRQDLNNIYNTKGLDALHKLLKLHDPEYYEKVDLSNPHRIIRALEISLISGKPYSSFRKEENKKREFNIIKIGLNLERILLYEKINSRVDEMMKAGFLDEVKKIHPHKKLNSLNTVGYKELISYLDGKYDLSEAVELIKKNTRNFAKRQLTWFRKDKEIKWFNPEQKQEIIKYINDKRMNA